MIKLFSPFSAKEYREREWKKVQILFYKWVVVHAGMVVYAVHTCEDKWDRTELLHHEYQARTAAPWISGQCTKMDIKG